MFWGIRGGPPGGAAGSAPAAVRTTTLYAWCFGGFAAGPPAAPSAEPASPPERPPPLSVEQIYSRVVFWRIRAPGVRGRLELGPARCGVYTGCVGPDQAQIVTRVLSRGVPEIASTVSCSPLPSPSAAGLQKLQPSQSRIVPDCAGSWPAPGSHERPTARMLKKNCRTLVSDFERQHF